MTQVRLDVGMIILDAAGLAEFKGLCRDAFASGWSFDALGQRIGMGSYGNGRPPLRPGVCLTRALADDPGRYHATTEHLRTLREVVRTKEPPPQERRLTPEEYLAGKSLPSPEQPMSKGKQQRIMGVKDEEQRIEGASLVERLRTAGWKNGQIAYICGYKNDSVIADILAFKTYVHAEALDALRTAQHRIDQPPVARYDRQQGKWIAVHEREERKIHQVAVAKRNGVVRAPEPTDVFQRAIVRTPPAPAPASKTEAGRPAPTPIAKLETAPPTVPARTLAGTASVVHSLAQARTCFETARGDAAAAIKAIGRLRISAEAGTAALNEALERAVPLMRPGLQEAIDFGESVAAAAQPAGLTESLLAQIDRLVADLTIG